MLVQNEHFLKVAYREALIPCVLSILSDCLNILADGILVGQCIGIDGLAALNLCVPLYLLLCVIGSFFASGTAIPAAEAIGEGEMEEAQRFYGTCFVCCIAASLAVTFTGLAVLPALARVMTPEESIRIMVMSYAGVTFAGALPKILIYIPFWYLRLEGKNRSVTAMMVIMGVGNIVLDIVFMYLMNWGVYGAALASVIATAAACLFGFIRLHIGHTNFDLKPAFLKERKDWNKIISAGSPASLNNLLQTIRILTINAFLYRIGGNTMVAVFVATNAVAAFAEAVTVGAPNAGTAMLGVYYGERDNGSSRILLRREWIDGGAMAAGFGILIIALSGVIRTAYGLNGISLLMPMICLAVSLFPGLWNNMMISYYNVSFNSSLSNLLIVCRVFLFVVVSLFACEALSLSIWLFLPLSECLTVVFWLAATKIISSRRESCTRYLLMDPTLQESGKVINFSLPGVHDEICSACEKISGFCSENGMSSQEYMKVSLSMEEIMTLITQVNEGGHVTFDLRVYFHQDSLGISIRYDGISFDPIHSEKHDEESFMGVRMIEKLVEDIVYRKVFGVNTLIIRLRIVK